MDKEWLERLFKVTFMCTYDLSLQSLGYSGTFENITENILKMLLKRSHFIQKESELFHTIWLL